MEPFAILSAVFIGEGTLLIRCAELFLNAGHEIRAIITAEPIVQDWADRKSIPYTTLDADLGEFLGGNPFDYLLSIVNLTILSAVLLALPRRGAINFHDALLPRFAGLHATTWALINREKLHGVTWHEMSEQVDAGRILKQRSVDIDPGETALSLNAKCYEAGAQSFAELVGELSAGTESPIDPQLEERSYFGKYKRPEAACLISWEKPAEEIAALVAGLTFGSYQNPLGLPKIAVDGTPIIVSEIEVLESASSAPSGTVTGVGDDAIRVATASTDVALRKPLTADGQPLAVGELVARFDIKVGYRFADVGRERAEHLTALDAALARHEAFWVQQLSALESIELPYVNRSAVAAGPTQYADRWMPVPDVLTTLSEAGARDASDLFIAAFAVYLARLGGKHTFDLGFSEPTLRQELFGLEGFFATHVPLRVQLRREDSVDDVLQAVFDRLTVTRAGRTYARDVVARYPELRAVRESKGRVTLPVVVEQVECPDQYEPVPGSELTVAVTPDGRTCRWIYDSRLFAEDTIARMQAQFATVLMAIAADGHQRLGELPLLSDQERRLVLGDWNDTRVVYPADSCIHQLIEAQVDEAPDAVAVVFEGRQITYRDLDRRANRVARYLQELGVGPETLVGICMERSIEMIVALLGVHKAGGAYVPLDPTYPRERLSLMVEDSGLSVLLTEDHLVSHLPEHRAHVVRLDAEREAIARESDARTTSDVTPGNLAYVIYTSGSTGKPKGVMVGHRNVVNFFVGMDDRLSHDPPGVWLAVTSLSFDISVLELFWTLARGFTVVLHPGQAKDQPSAGGRGRSANRPIEFSLSYFASDEGEGGADKYRLLMEGAKLADRQGFAAVWTPERHFHAFGGLYPNPSVASAAIAAVTERVKIRAGSVVLPLHSPIRVAEEWSLVDNLSKGRVGISFASGWQPNDFALAPHNFADRKGVMLREIETVRKLWRGETVAFPGPSGDDVEVRTLPRPVQPELPVWLTAAGSPETFRLAGEIGAGLLTHLLGQSVEELAEKLVIYRQAWRDHGHPGDGHVTLMLHTFVGDNEDAVRETVRAPMKEYLRSSVDLIKKAAWTFPALRSMAETSGKTPGELFDSGLLAPDEMDALLDHSFERYFKTSGLFGTPESCLEMIDKLKAIAVDEIACLNDFGVDSGTVLEHLERLAELKHLSTPDGPTDETDSSIPALILQHGVTHLQCTPSMANMLLMDEQAPAALSSLTHMMVGGEAFPVALAKQLKDLVSGKVINMYGPTETTIWSSTHCLNGISNSIPIGRPIANSELYILDPELQPVPIGAPGELFIGGDGVVRGYLNRPELTAERFIRHPLRDDPEARLYRTGDLARHLPDGNVEFLGRIDHQVKIRGHRIELGEIESLLHEHPSVQEAVVIAREDIAGDQRLVAYVVPRGGQPIDAGQVRADLSVRLPDFMVPSHVVSLDAFPLTPNAKIDRKALPAPEQAQPAADRSLVGPRTDTERILAEIWQTVLQVGSVGIHDKFFDLGGHSLLAVQLIAQIRDAFQVKLPLRMLVDAPTVADLAVAIEGMQINDADNDEIARALADLESLSDEEVRVLLEQEQ
jgi:natural product biosynthesis luciferase-like monooxygenase protein